MESNEMQMTEKESLQLITSMINKARNRFNETGALYLLYGWVILICCLVQFVALYFFKNHHVYYIWYFTWAAVIYQVVYLRKKRATDKTRTYTGEIIGFVWLVFIICISLLIFLQIYLKSPVTINPSILIMYGMPTFLSGVILKSNALKRGGVCCWLLAVLSMFIAYEFQLLLIALAVILAWIVPGYLFKRKFKKEN
jgi:hypothetical protein